MSTYIRLKDKLGRLKSLIKGSGEDIGESIEDAYLDIAGYCILTLTAKRNKESETKNPNMIASGERNEGINLATQTIEKSGDA